MKMWTSFKGLVIYGGSSILGIVLLLTIASFTPRKFRQYSPEVCSETIYITGNWFHSNLVLPVNTTAFNWEHYLDLKEIGQNGGDYRYLSFGWGDRDFYLNTPTLADFKFSTTFKALLIPSKTVLHVQGYYQKPTDRQDYRAKEIKLSTSNYLKLVNYLLNTFAQSDGTIERIRQSHRYYGSFYAAQGHYSIGKTCNDWIANGLRKADVNTPLWSGLAPSVIHHAETRCHTGKKSQWQDSLTRKKSGST